MEFLKILFIWFTFFSESSKTVHLSQRCWIINWKKYWPLPSALLAHSATPVSSWYSSSATAAAWSPSVASPGTPSIDLQEEHTDCILLIFSVILIISILLLLSLHLCLVSAQLLQGRKMLDQTAAAAQSRVWTDKTTMIYKAMIKPWRFSLQINNGIETRLEI